jgi:hypothetical protein
MGVSRAHLYEPACYWPGGQHSFDYEGICTECGCTDQEDFDSYVENLWRE